jgi:hypothetical protein
MSVNHELSATLGRLTERELEAVLQRLTAEEIEAGIAMGVWSEPKLALVKRYLDQMKLDQPGVVQAEKVGRSAMGLAWAAANMAKGANTTALVALIIAAGAMLAAVLSTVIAVVALRH